MIVLSHRGYWQQTDEKNQEIAFKRSFDLGFGTETDIRDHHGQLVISHDMPQGAELTLAEFLTILDNRSLPLALNIKADGLAAPLKSALVKAGVTNYFVFDMSVPDMRAYLQTDVPVFARMSEVEQQPVWLDHAAGIWLDGFSGIWYDTNRIEALLEMGKRVCVVSSELHKRAFEPLWQMLLPLANHPSLMLCTDYPEQAKTYFGGLQ